MMFVSHQEQRILEPLEYIAQVKLKGRWIDIGRRHQNYGDACHALTNYQRKIKKHSSGRIVLQGVTSTQDYSHHKNNL